MNSKLKVILSIGIILFIGTVLYISKPGNVVINDYQASKFKVALEKKITLVFAGDLMQHMPQLQAAKHGEGYCYEECFEYISPVFQEADIAVVNLETTLSETPPYSGYPNFCSPAELARDIKKMGVDVVLLANNHICDKGEIGIESTINTLDSVGIAHTGAFLSDARYDMENPLTIYRNGFEVHFLNYTYGTNGMSVPNGCVVNLIDTAVISRDIERIVRNENSLLFVCLHWGEEYKTEQSDKQVKLAEWLNRKGVDFVIGGHPHVIQPASVARGESGEVKGMTVYSLGNFVSNQQWENADGGMVLRINVSKQDENQSVILPEVFFAWTYKYTVDDKVHYRIIPSFAADTLLKDDSVAMVKYNRFVDNARSIVGVGEVLNEIK